MGSYGLVLGGGGAKGGYEIGVWKALREMNIPISAVFGTSVGALNGAIIAQKDFDTAYNLWTSLSVERVIKFERDNEEAEDGKSRLMNILGIIKSSIYSRGLDITPLKELLVEIVDEKRIRESEVDFGLVTFSLSDFKPVRLFKSDIPEGKLTDYLLASSCFPAFKRHEVDSKKFIDGGVYDNIPVSMAVDRGIRDIIAVDVSGPGLTRKVDTKNLNIITIKNSEDLGGVLNFSGERSKTNIELGYLDTLRAFGHLKGNKYYIVPSEEFKENKDLYIKSLGIDDFKKMYIYLGMDWSGKSTTSNRLIIEKVMRTIAQYTQDKLSGDTVFPAMAEIAAEQLGIDRRRKYSLNQLVNEIMGEYERIKSSKDFNDYMKNVTRLVLSRNQLEFERESKMNLIEGKFLISYDPYINENDEKIKRFRRFLAIAFPKISIANMFISLLISKRNSQD